MLQIHFNVLLTVFYMGCMDVRPTLLMWFYIIIPGPIAFSHLAAANLTINLANVSLGKPGLPMLVRR